MTYYKEYIKSGRQHEMSYEDFFELQIEKELKKDTFLFKALYIVLTIIFISGVVLLQFID